MIFFMYFIIFLFSHGNEEFRFEKNKNKNADLVFMHLNWIMMIFAFKIILY